MDYHAGDVVGMLGYVHDLLEDMVEDEDEDNDHFLFTSHFQNLIHLNARSLNRLLRN